MVVETSRRLEIASGSRHAHGTALWPTSGVLRQRMFHQPLRREDDQVAAGQYPPFCFEEIFRDIPEPASRS